MSDLFVRQSEFWDYFLAHPENHKLFSYNLNSDEQLKTFKEFVSVINIELASFCNRKCNYCPVGSLERKDIDFIDKNKLDAILNCLASINYSRVITLNLFNEPLHNKKDFLTSIRYIKSKLPEAYLRINSNGDYADDNTLKDLSKHGISEVLFTCHTSPGVTYSDDEKMQEVLNLIKKLGLEVDSCTRKSFSSGKNITYEFFAMNIKVLVVANNWDVYGVDRGGTLDHLSRKERLEPCLVPLREVTIDYRGKILWCWNIFRDDNFSFGEINSENSLIDAYFSKAYVDLRRHLATYSPKKSICASCSVSSHVTLNSKFTLSSSPFGYEIA